MIRVVLGVLLATGTLAIATGCATTIPMEGREVVASHEADIERLGAWLPARLWFHDLHGSTGRSVQIEGDSVSWVADGQLETAALADVRSIRFVDRRRGRIQGLRIGAAVGVASGLLLGVPRTGAFPTESSVGTRIALGVGLVGALTVPLGVLAGGVDGQQTIYRFTAPAD